MAIVAQPDVLSLSTRRVIRYHARRLKTRRVFSDSDLEDIEQELTLHLLRRIAQFDAAKASCETFVARVIAHKAANMLRDRLRQMQNRPLHISFSDLPEEALAREADDHEQLVDVVANVQATLPLRLCELCELLRYETPSEVARRLGISRSALDQAIRDLREYFANAGLRGDVR